MDALKKFLSGWGLAVIALIAGIGIGLLYAWQISPVEWTDTDPSSMRQELQVDYLRMVVESYFINNDESLADYRYQLLGDSRQQVLSSLAADENAVSSEALQQFTALVSDDDGVVTDGGEVEDGGEAQPAPGSRIFESRRPGWIIRPNPKRSSTSKPPIPVKRPFNHWQPSGRPTAWGTICTTTHSASRARHPVISWVNAELESVT